MSEKIKNYAGYLSKKLQNRCLRNPAGNFCLMQARTYEVFVALYEPQIEH